MNIDVTIQQNKQEYYLGNIALASDMELRKQSLTNIKKMVIEMGPGPWLDEATFGARCSMDNCEKRMIRQAELELIKAKSFLKTNYASKYRLEYLKVVLKNPVKTILAKCLLKLK